MNLYYAKPLWTSDDEVFELFFDQFNQPLLQSEQDDLCRELVVQLYYSNYSAILLLDALECYMYIVTLAIDAFNSLNQFEISFENQQHIKDLNLLYFNLRHYHSIYHNAKLGLGRWESGEYECPPFP